MKTLSKSVNFIPGSETRVLRRILPSKEALAVLALLISLILVPSRSHAFTPYRQLGCEAYPIALHVESLMGLEPGDATGNIHQGMGTGTFGWLRWTDDSQMVGIPTNSEEYLALELANPLLAAIDYREPQYKDPDDTRLNAGDWVWGLTGVVNSDEVRTELDRLVAEGEAMRVPVWDVAEAMGSSVTYHSTSFARVRLEGYDLASKELWFTFLGWDEAACPETYPDLVIGKSASPAEVRPGAALTYTLTFSNAGPAPAAGVVISDAMPSGLMVLSISHSGAAITPTGGTSYTWKAQDLAMDEGGVITITVQTAGALPVGSLLTNTAFITGTYVETDTLNNRASAGVVYRAETTYLPLIWK